MNKKVFALLFALCTIAMSYTTAAAQSRTVLSGNNLVTSDYLTYQSMGMDLSLLATGADYTWTTDSDAELISTDTNHDGQEMTGGEVKNHAGTYVANSKWSSNTASSAIFNLKDVYTVNQVDVWSSSTSYQQLGEIIVSVSNDGVTYEEVGRWQATVPPTSEIEQNTYGQANSYTACPFRDANARYIKITGGRASQSALGTTCYQYIFGEILIMGSQKIEPQPKAENLHFVDENGDPLYTYSGDGSAIVSADVYDCDADLITAIYGSDGALKKVFLKQGRYENFGKSYQLIDEIDDGEWQSGDVYKAFVFDSIKTMHPLLENAVLKETDITQTGLLTNDTPRVLGSVVYPVSAGNDWITTGKEASGSGFVGREAELFDGNIQNSIAVSTSDDLYANIQIHFNNVMKVEKTDVYVNCATNSYMSEYDIYASMDGVNYRYITTKTNTVSPSLGRISRVRTDIGGILYAKDIKLVMKKAPGKSEMAIAEVEVYGKPPAFKKQRMTDYTYETQVPFKTSEDIISADGTNSLLSDGDEEVSATSTGDYVSVIYTLSQYQQIEDVTIYGEHSGCELLLSPDGVSYQTAGFFPAVDGITKAYGKSDSNAKFAKLVFHKGSLAQIQLNEIRLYARNLYDPNEAVNQTPDPVTLRADLKPNNVLYIDWSDYNQTKNNVINYKVFIEDTSFVSTAGKSLKQVYCNGNPTLVSFVEGQFCLFSGLEPDKDYYVAVMPMTASTSNTTVTPVKIHTYSATGGEKLSGIFCINEFPEGGGAHVAHDNESANMQIKLKLITDMEVLSKTRYWMNTESVFKMYLSRGFGLHQYVRSQSETQMMNSYGIYSFVSSNEPDLISEYVDDPQKYIDITKNNYAIAKGINPKNMLCEASICGTDKLAFLEKLYQTDPAFGSYYDVCDVHAYCKAFEGKYNLEDNLSATSEAYSVPEHLFAKVNKIYNVLNQYNDGNKDLIFTETGWSTHTLPYNQEVVAESVTREQQANFVARCYLVSAIMGVKNVFLYAFQDESSATTDKEYQFGIVDWYGNPKPAYYTYYTLGKLLKEAVLVKQIETLQHPNYGAVFYDDEKDMYLTALWNISGATNQVTLSTADEKLLKIDAYGNAEYISSASPIQIGSAPVYIYTTDLPDVSE